MPKVKPIKPTIFLIKDEVTNSDDIFKDASKLTKATHAGKSLYYKPSPSNPPKWLSFVGDNFPSVDQTIFWNASAYAVVVLKVDNRFFVLPLGMGSHLIDNTKIEYNFGLKVAINCIPKGEVRQMDLTTPEANSQKTKKQSVKNATPEELGVNKQKDILRGVAGKLGEDHPLGEKIEGKDSIRVGKSIASMTDLENVCSSLSTYYGSEVYKDEYPWIDNMALIDDPTKSGALYNKLIANLKAGELEYMYISAPEHVEDLYKYEGFIFTGNNKRKNKKIAFPFPSIEDVITDLGDDVIQAMDFKTLSKTCRVFLRDEEGDTGFGGWPLSRCIAWEVEENGEKYILSEGSWYKINTDFYSQTEQFFNDRVEGDIGLPAIPADKKLEADYNKFVCDTLQGHYLFDLGHEDAADKYICADKNEACDIFDSLGKRFIHVKKSKSSPEISHLLRQGVFSGQAFKLDGTALPKFKGHLAKDGCPDAAVPLPYNPNDYKIAFVLMLGSNQKKDIPFFSKVSFRDAAEKALELMGYKCQFGYAVHTEPVASPDNEQ